MRRRVLCAVTTEWLPQNPYFMLSKVACQFFVWCICRLAGEKFGIEKDFAFSLRTTLVGSSGIVMHRVLHNKAHIGNGAAPVSEHAFYGINHRTTGGSAPMKKQKEPWLVLSMLATMLVLNRCMTVLFGAIMGYMCVIAARVVVTKNVSFYSIVGCQPRSLDCGANYV